MKFPLLVKFPLIFNLLDALSTIVKVADELIVKSLTDAVPEMEGENGVPVGTTTSTVLVGTVPPHQFEPAFQSVLVIPVQYPGVHEGEATVTIPVAVVPK